MGSPAACWARGVITAHVNYKRTIYPIPTLLLPLKGRKCYGANLLPLQGEGRDGGGVNGCEVSTMKGQTNSTILSPKLQRKLRRNMTEAEQRLWRGLRLKQFAGYKFRRQHPFNAYIIDFVCL